MTLYQLTSNTYILFGCGTRVITKFRKLQKERFCECLSWELRVGLATWRSSRVWPRGQKLSIQEMHFYICTLCGLRGKQPTMLRTRARVVERYQTGSFYCRVYPIIQRLHHLSTYQLHHIIQYFPGYHTSHISKHITHPKSYNSIKIHN